MDCWMVHSLWCQNLKSFQCTKDAFLKGVELETWEEATETLPEFTQALKEVQVEKGNLYPQTSRFTIAALSTNALYITIIKHEI